MKENFARFSRHHFQTMGNCTSNNNNNNDNDNDVIIMIMIIIIMGSGYDWKGQ